MKKKIIIIVSLLVLIGVVVLTLVLLPKKNNKKEAKLTTITMDINPSIEIKIDDKEIVKSIKALNDDAKELELDKLNNKSLDKVFNIIVNKIIENDYSHGDRAYIILNVDGNIKSNVIEQKLNNEFEKHHYDAELIVPVITEQAKKDAKKYNITPAKAAYLEEVIKDNKDIDMKSLIDKPVRELKEMQIRQVYCPDGYTLEGEVCTKVIKEEQPTLGNVCPDDYEDADGVCYKKYGVEDEDTCTGGQTLKNGKCVGNKEIDALVKYTCTTGELIKRSEIPYRDLRDSGNPEDMMCMDTSTGQKPIQRCLLNSGHIMINGECYNGPAPLIDGGCPGPDLPINGWCYSKDDGDQWQCPDGNIYEYSKGTNVDYCPDTFTYTFASSTLYCEDGYELIDGKCVTNKSTKPEMIRYCKNGYTLYEDRMCLDYSDSKSYIEGTVCDYPDSRLVDGKCIIYDIQDALK